MNCPPLVLVVLLVLFLVFFSFLIVLYWIPKGPVRYVRDKFFPEVQLNLHSCPKYKSPADNSYTTSKDRSLQLDINSGIALTFDDVPHRTTSFTRILDLLDKYQVKATFFVISGQVNPENRPLLLRALEEGHQLGNHGRTDSVHLKKSPKDFEDEFEHCHQLLEDLYREANVALPKQMIYRPGCGWFSRRMINYLTSRNYRLVMGSVYPNDPLVRSAHLNFLYLKKHLQDGDIVILHDRDWTPALLEKLLPWISAEGYLSETIDFFD